jgi:uncharacterized protein YbaR (Trm112 family)
MVRRTPMLSPDFVALLVCPTSQQPLVYFPRGAADRTEDDAFLLCPASGLRYRVEHGVPVLLADEAERVPQDMVSTLVARARTLGLTVPTTSRH